MLFAKKDTEEACTFFHKWVVAKNWHGNKYSECKDCSSRRIEQEGKAPLPNLLWVIPDDDTTNGWVLPNTPIREKR